MNISLNSLLQSENSEDYDAQIEQFARLMENKNLTYEEQQQQD